jgi:hypothetical protein
MREPVAFSPKHYSTGSALFQGFFRGAAAAKRRGRVNRAGSCPLGSAPRQG